MLNECKHKQMKIKKGFFITGTNTGVGKTSTACLLLKTLNSQGYKTAALKPVATGCEQTSQGLRSADALLLQDNINLKIPYQNINPFAFAPPIAPHIAAEQAKVNLTVSSILHACLPVLQSEVDYVMVEGVGGFCVPLNNKETTIELAQAFNFPVILVVGLRLGCLNHALLTYQSIKATNLALAGWVGFVCDIDMLVLEENIKTLKNKILAPFLGKYPQCFEGGVEEIIGEINP